MGFVITPEDWNPEKKTITSRQVTKLLTTLKKYIVTDYNVNYSQQKQFTIKKVENINPIIKISFKTNAITNSSKIEFGTGSDDTSKEISVSFTDGVSILTPVMAYDWIRGKLNDYVNIYLNVLSNKLYDYLVSKNAQNSPPGYDYPIAAFNGAITWTIPALNNINPLIKIMNNYYEFDRVNNPNHRIKVNAIVLSPPFNYGDTNEPIKAIFLYDYKYSEPVYNITLTDAYTWIITFLNNY